jgi:hypothetical protein
MIKNEDIINMICKECGIDREIKTQAYLSKTEALTILVCLQKLKLDADDSKNILEKKIPISEIISLVRKEIEKESELADGK